MAHRNGPTPHPPPFSILNGGPDRGHREDLEVVRMWFLYWRLRPCIQNLRRGVSSSFAPITCISFFVSSEERPPPAFVNLNLTFTLLNEREKHVKSHHSFFSKVVNYSIKGNFTDVHFFITDI